MPAPDRIYLDNAATSFPKPPAVYDAVDAYNRRSGAAVGRSAYRDAIEVQSAVDRCRKRVADFLGAESLERIIFTFNGTDSLNLALHGLLKPGDHVVTSTIEHNSVLRPLKELSLRQGIEVTYVPADSACRVDPSDVRSALRPNTRLVALIHASNVTGTLQPIDDVGEIARQAGALFLVDAAQSAGHVPIDVRRSPIDLLACPGHKGLLGPLGTGILYIRPGAEAELASLRQGGTGSNSEDDSQPAALPDKYESGNHNAPGLCGLDAAVAYLQSRGIDEIRRHERELTAQLLAELEGVVSVYLYGPRSAEEQVGVVSLSIDGYEPQHMAAILDEHFGIQTRAGLHCAPGAHKCIERFEAGGTVRFSFGPVNTRDDVAATAAALREIASHT
jgi:cysteine desulfurase family protein